MLAARAPADLVPASVGATPATRTRSTRAVTLLRAHLEASADCGGSGQAACDDFALCVIAPAEPEETCLESAEEPAGVAPGFCYLDPDGGRGDPSIFDDCSLPGRRLVRLVGRGLPSRDSEVVLVCPEAGNAPREPRDPH